MAQTTVPLNAPSEQPTRRVALGALAAGILGGAAATPLAAAGEVDPHLAWEDEARTFNARWMAAVGVDQAAETENMAAWDDRCCRIVSTAPSTPNGLAAQLRAIFWGPDLLHPDDYLDGAAEHQARVVERVVTTLDRFAAGRA